MAGVQCAARDAPRPASHPPNTNQRTSSARTEREWEGPRAAASARLHWRTALSTSLLHTKHSVAAWGCPAAASRETAIQMRDQLAKVDELAGNLENRVARARERAEVPLARELDDFRAAGAEVVICLSREPASGEGGYADGYVQDVARERAGAASVAYFVAGQTRAETGVRALAIALSARVYSNY